jgi:hypothetical protein
LWSYNLGSDWQLRREVAVYGDKAVVAGANGILIVDAAGNLEDTILSGTMYGVGVK